MCVSVTPSISEVTYSMPKGMQEVCLNVQYVGFFAFCKARAAKENLQSPKCLYRSIRRKVHTISWKSGCPALTCRGPCRYPFCFFSPYFSALHPTLCHICRCGCQPRSQANFTSECKRILAPIPEIKFKMLLGLLGSVETCPVISVGLVRYMIYVVLLEFSQLSISECVRCLI